jgi:hypothetical protein
MRHLGAAALSGLLILLAVSLAGCPRQRPELRVPITQLNLVEPGASASLEIRNAGRGKLEWSVTADAPWILLDRTEGEGEATVQVTIDAALLEPLSVNRGAITVRSNGGEKQVPVEAPTPVAALSPDYWPLEVGNEWTFNLAANAFPWIIYKDNIAPPRPFEIVTLRVADFRLVSELEVWRIDVDFIEEPTRPEKIVELEPVIRAFLRAAAWPTYWVKVGPEWFVALDEARVAGLPNTDGFMRVADLAKLPGYAAYVFYTDRLWTLTDEIEAVTAAVREELEPLDPELEAYFDRVYRGDRTQVEALLAAAAEAYRGYSGSPHPLVNDVLSLVGDAAAGALPAADTAAELQGILSDTQVALNEYLEAAPEPTREDAVALLQAFGAEFQGYQNPDALLRGLVRFLAFGARKGAELLDTYEDMPPEDRGRGRGLLGSPHGGGPGEPGRAAAGPARVHRRADRGRAGVPRHARGGAGCRGHDGAPAGGARGRRGRGRGLRIRRGRLGQPGPAGVRRGRVLRGASRPRIRRTRWAARGTS